MLIEGMQATQIQHTRFFQQSNAGQPQLAAELQPSGHKPGGHGNSPSSIYIRSEQQVFSSSVYSFAPTQTAPVEAVTEPAAGAVKAASTILAFVEAQLARDLADGASTEQLASRLEAGLQGFQQGFGEAAEILAELGGVDAGVWAEIQQTHDLVLEGFDALQRQYLPGSESLLETDPGPAAVAVPDKAGSAFYSRSDSAERSSFSFSVTTADGDKVNIKAASLKLSMVEAQIHSLEGLQGRFRADDARQQQFSLKVNGELDSDELTAIEDLLGQVAELSSRFFDGDVQQAFAMATELGFDSSEIASFALKLRHSSVQRMSQAYTQTQAYTQDQVSPTSGQTESLFERLTAAQGPSSGLLPLADYAEKVAAAQSAASRFQQPLELMQAIAQQFESSHRAGFVDSLAMLLPKQQ